MTNNADSGFADLLRGKHDTSDAQQLLAEHPGLRFVIPALGWRLSTLVDLPSSATAAPAASSLLDLIPSILSSLVGASQDAIREFLQPQLRWLEPAVLGDGDPLAIDIDRPHGVFLTKLRLRGPRLAWRASDPTLRGASVALRQLDSGPNVIGRGTDGVVQFDTREGSWIVDPALAQFPDKAADRWFVIAAEKSDDESDPECIVVRFEQREEGVESAPSAYAAVRDGFVAEAIGWFARESLRPKEKCAFLASAISAQGWTFGRYKKDILKDVADAYLFEPGSVFATERPTKLQKDVNALLLQEVIRAG